MFRFEREQRECEIGGVRFGGQPGRYATVLAPSIFQKGDRVFEGGRKGGFDRGRAGELIRMCDRLSEETGVP
ncbi:MAG: tetrahydromethanopterin S-methyltransferase subunit H, partial [Desulfomonilaceae bacterium]